MLTLYHAPQSRSGRIVWLLEEIGADYDIRYVDIVHGDGSGRSDPANVHPDRKVPALVHDDALVTESMAIALYLTDLLPDVGLGVAIGDADRGAYVTWLAWGVGELESAIFQTMFGGGDDPRVQASFAAAMTRIEDALWAGPYLMGDRFTAADVLIGGSLGWAKAILPKSERLDAYLARLAERPASVAACAKDAPAPAREAA